jgi:hypothetical protein
MRTIFIAVPALLLAGVSAAQSDPRDARAKVPPVEFRSTFEGYRPYADQSLRDWRKSNEEVGRQGPQPHPPVPASPGGGERKHHGSHK